MAPLGLAFAGPLSDALGVRTWFLIGGLVTGLLGLAGFFMPSVLTLEDHQGGAEASPVLPEHPTGLGAPSVELD
jgi:DHA3 family macrolide efflux protein-like MFS transporter